MAEEYKSLHPQKFYNHYLKNGIRPDGRTFDKTRSIMLNVKSIPNADGSAICKIGQTTIICGVKAELCKPKPEAPSEGFIIPNVDLPPLCSARFRPGPPSDQAQVFSQFIGDIIQNSGCINLKSLCLHPDKLAWCLYADLICLDYDGSIIDACVIALMSALRTMTLPTIDYDPALENVQTNLEDRRPLMTDGSPVSTTFVVFDDQYILTDPTAEEEDLSSGTVTVVINKGELCYVHKPGGTPLEQSILADCISKAKARTYFIQDLIFSVINSSNN